jgi:Zn-finger nucleic acid-binding protein
MCPDCHQPLIVVEFEGVELDYCLDCHGTWFDAGELELIGELAGVQTGRLAEALRRAGCGRSSARRCPRCRRRMRVVSVGEAPSVAVDRCPRGHGLWLDAGELVTIVKSFTQGDEAAVAAFVADLLRHGLTGQTGKG